jgi:hypothetical protein
MVAPKGIVKDETLLLTPMRCSTVLIVTGIVAPLDAVLKAKAKAGRNLLRKVFILRPVKNFKSAE